MKQIERERRIVQGCVWDNPSGATQTKPWAVPSIN